MTRQNYIPAKDEQCNVNALIPLWDMCNHTNGYLTTQFKSELKRSECLAFKAFKEGEQVLIFYGKRSNSDFLLHNGFVYPENQHDSYRLKLGISKADPLYESRLKLLNRLGIPPSGEFYLYGGSEPLDAVLLAFLRVFNMDEGNLQHWLDSERAEDLGCVDCALDTEIECKVWNFLFKRVELLLLGYSRLPKVKPTRQFPVSQNLIPSRLPGRRTRRDREPPDCETALQTGSESPPVRAGLRPTAVEGLKNNAPRFVKPYRLQFSFRGSVFSEFITCTLSRSVACKSLFLHSSNVTYRNKSIFAQFPNKEKWKFVEIFINFQIRKLLCEFQTVTKNI
ncbi:UNVERIFIED_CONTAM: hypothetical protein PYX00_001782 [Menopon gallinae]|uniref:protein-histidine N-methyltransferase n=1 Tax=Menopon gallinae TaxID=328185 RepID=A0AAW2IFD4_9NEOP